MKFVPRGRVALATAAAAALMLTAAACSSSSTPGGSSSTNGGAAGDVTIGIVNLNLDNPFFSTLGKGTEDAAKALGWKVMTAAAKQPGDSATQVTAIENMITSKVKAIVLTPASATALNDAVKKARDAGILVITVNGTLDPIDTADTTYATDNVQAGKLIGQWAKAAGPADASIALLDFDLSDGPAKGRHDGFLAGYGIAENASQVAGEALTKGTIDTGQSAMENLLSAHPGINLVYTINEPAAHGASTAIQAAGKSGVTIVSVDGACSGVQDVKDGIIGATAMQFPDRMGSKAVEAIATFLKDGTRPPSGVTDSGTELITDHAVSGLASQDSTWGLAHCWGQK
ncbi:MAG: substrate-binding domain-containing protein [Cellulomonas sp.]|nr:substrate-binding domain-containing protein [Cellulomonas sp.]